MKCEARHIDLHMRLRRGVFKRLPRVPACPVRRVGLQSPLDMCISFDNYVLVLLDFSCVHRPRREQVTVQSYSSIQHADSHSTVNRGC